MKEQRFEKVVEWKIDCEIYTIFFWLSILYNLILGFIFKDLTIILDFNIIVLIIGLMGLIGSRKVYWRKI
jgi:hypothetical protein